MVNVAKRMKFLPALFLPCFFFCKAAEEVPAYWGTLKPGHNSIGFTQRWVIDSTRRLPGGDTIGLRFRPVLMNLWYPSTVVPTPSMQYRDYFDGADRAAAATGVARYAKALTEYQRTTALEEVLRGNDTIPEFRLRFQALLDSRTAVHRDAPLPRGRFPVVVYTSGARSSYDDNVVLCEYLASHGYLVLGSAFPRENNEDFTTSVMDESRQRDIRWLLLELRRLHPIEVGPVVAVGHSAGAQALLLFATDSSAPIDAIISFDTTQDYVRLVDRTFSHFTDRLIEMRSEVCIPIVFVAGPEALFELGDSLSSARRWFVEVPYLSHNDYLSQGIIRREMSEGFPWHDSTRAKRARESYEALVSYTESWIQWFTSGSVNNQGPRSRSPLKVWQAAKGDVVPKPQQTGVISSREMRHRFSAGKTNDLVGSFVEARIAGAVSGSDEVLSKLLTGTIAEGRRDRAKTIYSLLLRRDSTVSRVLTLIANRAKLFQRIQAPELAMQWWEYAAALDSTTALKMRAK